MVYQNRLSTHLVQNPVDVWPSFKHSSRQHVYLYEIQGRVKGLLCEMEPCYKHETGGFQMVPKKKF